MFESSYKRMNDKILPDLELITKTLDLARQNINLRAKSSPFLQKKRKLVVVVTICILIAVAAFGTCFLMGISFPDTTKTSPGLYIPSGAIVFKTMLGQSSSNCYVAPENGSCLYFVEVESALKTYALLDVTYYVGISIMADQAPIDKESERLEMARLNSLGYHVGYAKSWEYKSPDEKISYSYLAGYLTADELLNFSVSENYGYSFYFARYGDGSPVDGGEGIVVDFPVEGVP